MSNKLRELVNFYEQAGAKAVVENTPRLWAHAQVQTAPAQTLETKTSRSTTYHTKTIQAPNAEKTNSSVAWQAKNIEELKQALENFDGCALKQTAKNTVFADGNPTSGFMLVGEAPGADEDEQGLPFVGQSGQLLNAMLEAIGINRSAGECYITNVIPWRPPANRPPSLDEIAACRPFLDQHIALAQPRLLVLLGGIACKTLLNETSTGAMRGKVHQYTMINGETIPTCVTYHPAYLLRSPKQKGAVWHDWLMIKRILSGENKS